MRVVAKINHETATKHKARPEKRLHCRNCSWWKVLWGLGIKVEANESLNAKIIPILSFAEKFCWNSKQEHCGEGRRFGIARLRGVVYGGGSKSQRSAAFHRPVICTTIWARTVEKIFIMKKKKKLLFLHEIMKNPENPWWMFNRFRVLSKKKAVFCGVFSEWRADNGVCGEQQKNTYFAVQSKKSSFWLSLTAKQKR